MRPARLSEDCLSRAGDADFVDDDERIGYGAEVKLGVAQFGQIRRSLQIEIHSPVRAVLSDHQGQRGLARLARPDNPDGRKPVQG
jgi:hypothetical protein